MLLGEVDSLKHKRAVIRPVLARLRRLDVAVTEVRRSGPAPARPDRGGDRCPVTRAGAPGAGHLRAAGRRRAGDRAARPPTAGSSAPARRVDRISRGTGRGRACRPAVAGFGDDHRTRRRSPMADSARARRLAKRIVAIVATELELSVKDPRLAMVTITAATVTPDLREADGVLHGLRRRGRGDVDGRGAGQRHRSAAQRGRPARPASSSPRRWLSGWTPCRRTRTASTSCSRPPRPSDAEVAPARRRPATPASPIRTRRPGSRGRTTRE